jgi:hypothetical protein
MPSRLVPLQPTNRATGASRLPDNTSTSAPAMSAGLSKTLWRMDGVVKMVEEWEAAR